MKNKFNKKIAALTLFLGLISSCVNDTFDTPKWDNCVDLGLTATQTIAEIYAIAINPEATPPSLIPNTPTCITDEIIEAYVISSDEGGNFYKSMYFQAIDGSRGFNLSIDESNLYTKGFQPGKKIFLKLKGLAYGNPSNYGVGLIFGAPPTEQFSVDRLSTLEYKNHLFSSCNSVSEEDIVHKITLEQAVKGDDFLNTLVEIDDVQFTDGFAGGTYDSNRTDPYDSSVFVTNGTTSLTIRTSRYANFAGYKVPVGRGKIRGVLTKYNTAYQIIMRSEKDAVMLNPRVDLAPALIGTNSTTFPATVNETFESYNVSPSQTNFQNFINDAYMGSRYWGVKTFNSNKYIEMSSFGSGSENASYLFVPVNMDAANTFSFKSNVGYWNGAVLNVYYVLAIDYTPGGKIDVRKMINITSHFTIPKTPTNAYGTIFTASGVYAIPENITGNGYFVFEYSGNANALPALTTNLQLDDIKVN